MKKIGVHILAMGVMAVAACSPTASNKAASDTSSTQASATQVDSQKQSLVSFKLTDAPNKDFKSVVVNIDHMEVLVAGTGKSGRLILAENLGPVDLLKLQNGVTLPLQDVVAPVGLQVQQIRLVLKEEGHYAVKGDDSVCELKTPSAQKTGVKIILTNKVQFEAGYQYSIVVDFDALKSVVAQGNGGCLLKPVLKLKSALKIPVVVNPDPGVDQGSGGSGSSGGGSDSGSGGGTVTEPSSGGGSTVTDPGSSTGGGTVDPGSTGGGDSSAGVTDPAVGTDPATGSGGSTTSPGEELVTNPDANTNPPVDGGWDYTPVVDPVVTQDQLIQLM